jgi:FixJ family two-component response regulator
LVADYGADADRVAISAPNRLVVSFRAGYNLHKEGCERHDRKSRIEETLQQLTGTRVQVQFELLEGEPPTATARPVARSPRQMMRETERHELVSRAIDLFDAEVVRVDASRDGKP